MLNFSNLALAMECTKIFGQQLMAILHSMSPNGKKGAVNTTAMWLYERQIPSNMH